MLDVTRLRVIDALARLGSVTAAARELHSTQPTVSHHLAPARGRDRRAQLLQRAPGAASGSPPAGQLPGPPGRPRSSGRIDAADAELSAHTSG
jgi:DNA-binding transcriptional LysR family regulator